MSLENAFPVIDPTIRHVGVSKLREMNATVLKETEDTFVIQDNNTPIAVLLTYEKFMTLQEKLISVMNTLELLADSNELAGVLAGIQEMRAGRARPLVDVEAELKTTK